MDFTREILAVDQAKKCKGVPARSEPSDLYEFKGFDPETSYSKMSNAQLTLPPLQDDYSRHTDFFITYH